MNTDKQIQWRDASNRSIALAGIENKSHWLRDDAKGLQAYVKMLDGLPKYPTVAEEAFTQAETALTEALLCVKLLKTELAKKRIQSLETATSGETQ